MNLSKGDGQGGLACCSPWGYEESDTSEQPNWTELNWSQNSACHKLRAMYLITKETTISIIIMFIITNNNNSIMTIVNWVFIVLWWGGMPSNENTLLTQLCLVLSFLFYTQGP